MLPRSANVVYMVLTFFAIAIALYTGLQSLLINDVYNSVTNCSPRDNVSPLPETPKRSKVLLMTYMRGGSTLMGQVFNQDPSVLYWFEPIDGVYSDMYAASHGWFPLDLLYNIDGGLRNIPADEQNAVVENIERMFRCDMDRLPVDVLSNYNLLHIVSQKMAGYIACVNKTLGLQVTLGNVTSLKYPRPKPWNCKTHMSEQCPRRFSNADNSLLKCKQCLHQNNLTHAREEYTRDDANASCGHMDRALHLYGNCMNLSKTGTAHCVPLLVDTCTSSRVIALKVIRMRADLLFRMMTRDPDIKVIYQVRDPRAIAYSRQSLSLLSAYSQRDIVKEAYLLCQRMLYDITVINSIREVYPNRILQVTYEDLVREPITVVEQTYQFLGISPVPEEVTSWFAEAKNGSKTDYAFGTHRAKPLELIDKWKRNVLNNTAIAMTNHCRDVLQQFAYI